MDRKDPDYLLQHLDTFFGVRNKIKGEPIVGVNFTRETLTYMTSKSKADRITQMIVDQMKQKGVDKFGVFECCAGMGGNTLSFLDNPHVNWVVSYEINDDRRAMLKRNISMYKLAEGNRSFVPDGGFPGVPASHAGSVLYFDPPWLPPQIKGQESTKDQYILENIMIGDKTLEHWMEQCRHCAMIVARVPPGYKVQQLPGFDIQTESLKNSLVIFATPVSATPVSATIQPLVAQTDGNWYVNLQNYLRNLLKVLIPNPDFIEKMVSPEAMEIWVPCFTHESYDPNVGKNYEELEMVGDHAMEYNFILYLYKTIPNISRAGLNDLKAKYVSKPYQAKVAARLKMGDQLRTKVPMDTHSLEDVLEAFFGGLNLVGDKVFKFGAGTGLCFNMINYIYKDVQMTMEYAKNPKTQIKETFERLGWVSSWGDESGNVESFEETTSPEGRRTIVGTIRFTPEALDMLRVAGLTNVNPILATEYGSTKKVTSNNVYKTALTNLRKIGITREWVDKVKGSRDLKNPILIPYIQPVQQKATQEGYSRFYIHQAKQTKDGKYFQLIGVKPDETKVVLTTTTKPLDENEGKKLALELYLK